MNLETVFRQGDRLSGTKELRKGDMVSRPQNLPVPSTSERGGGLTGAWVRLKNQKHSSSLCGTPRSAASLESWHAGSMPGPTQGVKDPALPQLHSRSQLQPESDPWSRNSLCCRCSHYKKKKSEMLNSHRYTCKLQTRTSLWEHQHKFSISSLSSLMLPNSNRETGDSILFHKIDGVWVLTWPCG